MRLNDSLVNLIKPPANIPQNLGNDNEYVPPMENISSPNIHDLQMEDMPSPNIQDGNGIDPNIRIINNDRFNTKIRRRVNFS